MTAKKANIAVILSGCGVQDGAEIQEAVLTMLAIDRHGARCHCFAPDMPQHEVVDHRTGHAVSERRNVLVESARIARGQITDLAQFDAAQFDAVIFPGGFGVAKNLCTLATDGAACAVQPDVAAAVTAMHGLGKPIGALCIAPALVARVLGHGEVTIGHDADTAAAITQMGGTHTLAGHAEVVVDHKARLVTTPCYMLDATISQIAEGADNAVKAVLRMVAETAAV